MRIRALVLIWVLLVVYVTLFPFDFNADANSAGLLASVEWRPVRVKEPWDEIRNLLLFIPLGFGLAGFDAERGVERCTSLWHAVSLCAVLSLTVEVLQLWLPLRISSVGDFVANVAGGLMGYGLFLSLGSISTTWRNPWVVLSKNTIRTNYLLSIIGIYLLLLILGVYWLQQKMDLENWSSTYRLAIGNETSGDRPWHGHIERLLFTDRVLSATEIVCLVENSCPASALGKMVVADYRPVTANLWVDRSGQQPELVRTPAERGEKPFGVITEWAWFQSSVPVEELNRRLQQSSAFTVYTEATAANAAQYGPARVATISDGPHFRNFTIGQEDDNLVIRLRTEVTGANGMLPELVVRDFWNAAENRRLAIVFANSQLLIYADAPAERYRFDLSLHTMLFRFLLPVDRWQLHPGGISQLFYAFFYSTFLWGPFAILVVVLHQRIWRRFGVPSRMVYVLFLLAPILLETLIAYETRQPLSLHHVVASGAIMTLFAQVARK